MKFISFSQNKTEDFGVLAQDENHVISLKEKTNSQDLLEYIISGDFDKDTINNVIINNSKLIPLEDIKVLSPIMTPRRNIICLGLNYLDHAKESEKFKGNNFKLPEAPAYFSKMASKTIGHDEILILDESLTKMLDYEVELAIIIGKEGKNISKDEANEYIFGYTILNDFTARDLQRKHTQWFKGKSLDGYTSLGPVITHASDFLFPPEIYLRSYVNGELRQASKTTHLIYDIATIISDFSKGITLLPGDIIATGTPAGVGMGFDPPRFLQRGDEVVCEIQGIGMLRNVIK
jgi:2-keto-4-pentenoate hydratase/2-oxohepta-3-ene-1,7-dioic acid hydratase in catechol pathway